MNEGKNIWIFSNYKEGHFAVPQELDWDLKTTMETKHYYLNDKEKNRIYVKNGDIVIFRNYSEGFWGTCRIASEWIEDKDGETKHNRKTGWYEIADVEKFKTTLPYEVIYPELSNKNWRLRIARATKDDLVKIRVAESIFRKLNYGPSSGEFVILEDGLEEAVKKNLKQLRLRLASEDIRQQCSLGIGIGRTDLICRDDESNYVILELKARSTSDEVMGQIMRYMGFVKANWAEKEGKKVKGIILTPRYDEKLRLAELAAKGSNIKVMRLRIG